MFPRAGGRAKAFIRDIRLLRSLEKGSPMVPQRLSGACGERTSERLRNTPTNVEEVRLKR
jgi:hypothetical protein